MSDREDMVALADWLSEQQTFHDGSLARNDPFIQTHIERLRQWEKLVRSAARTGPDVGYVAVPTVPTKEMLEAGVDNNPTSWNDNTDPQFMIDVANDVYVAMVKAAPKQPATPGYVAGFEACREACKRAVFSELLQDCTGTPDDIAYNNAIHCALDAIAALPAPATASAGWQPIETAPKDGTLLLLGWPTFHPLVGHCEDDLWGQLNSDFGFEPFENAPSHWMPLPAAPTITRKSEERV